jgi:hypothetical protein
MSTSAIRSKKQINLRWLMIAVLVAAVDFALARALMGTRAPYPNVEPILLTIVCYDLLLCFAYRQVTHLKHIGNPGRKPQYHREGFEILLLGIVLGLPMIYSIVAIFDLIPARFL